MDFRLEDADGRIVPFPLKLISNTTFNQIGEIKRCSCGRIHVWVYTDITDAERAQIIDHVVRAAGCAEESIDLVTSASPMPRTSSAPWIGTLAHGLRAPSVVKPNTSITEPT